MYGYQDFIELSPEQILQKVTQEQIFEFVLQEPFNYAFRYLSPCRDDKKAGCRFEYREDGTILFVDFGERFLTGRTHRNCFGLLMDKERCELQRAIQLIVEKFNLPIDGTEYKPIVDVQYKKKSVTSQRSEISYIAKPYNKFDIQYWSQFLIRQEQLLSDDVYSVREYTVNSPTKGLKKFTPYKYCYAIDFLTRIKIYQPYKVNDKWITNVDENIIGNINNLPDFGDELIIQKSYKDHRVLRNTIPTSDNYVIGICYFQNEGSIPSDEILRILVNRFKLITIFYDNDHDGVVAALRLWEAFNNIKEGCARVVHLPIFISRKLTHKDPGEFIHKEGRSDLWTVLKYILWENNFPNTLKSPIKI